MERIPILVIVIAAFVVGFGANVGFEALLKEYQTLISGLLAVGAAWVALLGINRQIQANHIAEQDRRNRQRRGLAQSLKIEASQFCKTFSKYMQRISENPGAPVGANLTIRIFEMKIENIISLGGELPAQVISLWTTFETVKINVDRRRRRLLEFLKEADGIDNPEEKAEYEKRLANLCNNLLSQLQSSHSEITSEMEVLMPWLELASTDDKCDLSLEEAKLNFGVDSEQPQQIVK